jgi:rSAM/selenodomain-associated transferase 2
VAIVMPTLNEVEGLARFLGAALAAGGDELVVSDGGSSDGTPELARALGARVVVGPAGRGGQLNRGAAAASAEVLLFLHADTLLPQSGVERVRRAVAAGAEGGGFLVRFAEPSVILRLGERAVNLRTRSTRLPLGDQAQFATRATFDRLGGFADWPILEDLDFARRLKRRGRVAVLAPPVVTSARRFLARGPIRTVATNWLIWTLFALGVSPRSLARLYLPLGHGCGSGSEPLSRRQAARRQGRL